jgi:hypothetical protein
MLRYSRFWFRPVRAPLALRSSETRTDRPAANSLTVRSRANTVVSAMAGTAGTSCGQGGADVLGVAAAADDPELASLGVERPNDPTRGHQRAE